MALLACGVLYNIRDRMSWQDIQKACCTYSMRERINRCRMRMIYDTGGVSDHAYIRHRCGCIMFTYIAKSVGGPQDCHLGHAVWESGARSQVPISILVNIPDSSCTCKLKYNVKNQCRATKRSAQHIERRAFELSLELKQTVLRAFGISRQTLPQRRLVSGER